MDPEDQFTISDPEDGTNVIRPKEGTDFASMLVPRGMEGVRIAVCFFTITCESILF